METLKQVVPEFADPQKASQVRDRLVTMGQEIYGYEPNEISAVMDHRAIRVLNDAIKYQELTNHDIMRFPIFMRWRDDK